MTLEIDKLTIRAGLPQNASADAAPSVGDDPSDTCGVSLSATERRRIVEDVTNSVLRELARRRER